MSGGPDRIRLVLERPDFRLDVDLELPARGITVLFGPSGSGKTTLLRCVAGLERAAGEVHVAGAVWQDGTRFLPTWRRPLGYVFQEASLFPHLTVAANLSYAQRRAGQGAASIPIDRIVELLALAPLLQRAATQLSGGERQRVAIARALATGPQLLLLDEPLAALDPARRREVLPWLEGLRANLGLPMLYVTHSAEEMARLADTVVLLDQGRVRAAGAPGPTLARLDIALLPEDDAGALLDGRVGARDEAWRLVRIDFDGGSLWVRDDGTPLDAAARVRVLARDVSIATEVPPPQTQSIQNLVRCTVRAVAAGAHPSQAMVQLDCGSAQLLARITARAAHQLGLAPGLQVWAQVKSAALLQ